MGWTREQEAGGLNLRYELVPLGKSPPKNLPPIPLSYFDPGPPAGYRLVQTPPLPLPGTLPPAAAAAPPLPRPKPSRFFGPKTLLALLSLCQGILLLTFFLVRTAPPLKAILLTLLLASLIPEAFLLPPILRPQTARVLILEPDCPLYPVPHTETRVLRKLKRGALLELIEGSDRWLHVRDASGQGWVSRSAGRVHHL
ncbi:MAG TPA: hypothetical protein ENK02_14175 [Planctomycetes bacterium]|nr:hypothetical protein [Planctomycetota bacterium]